MKKDTKQRGIAFLLLTFGEKQMFHCYQKKSSVIIY